MTGESYRGSTLIHNKLVASALAAALVLGVCGSEAPDNPAGQTAPSTVELSPLPDIETPVAQPSGATTLAPRSYLSQDELRWLDAREQTRFSKHQLLTREEEQTPNTELTIEDWSFLGAMGLRSYNDGQAQERWYRLNASGVVGDWIESDPMLPYGAVLIDLAGDSRTIDQLGVEGERVVAALHNVTLLREEDASLVINGEHYYSHRGMLSPHNEVEWLKSLGDKSYKPEYEENLSVGDEAVLIVNRPDGDAVELTYRLSDIGEIRPSYEEFSEIFNTPDDPTASQLVIVSCWPPGSAALRKIYIFDLTNRKIAPAQIESPGDQPPRFGTQAG